MDEQTKRRLIKRLRKLCNTGNFRYGSFYDACGDLENAVLKLTGTDNEFLRMGFFNNHSEQATGAGFLACWIETEL